MPLPCGDCSDALVARATHADSRGGERAEYWNIKDNDDDEDDDCCDDDDDDGDVNDNDDDDDDDDDDNDDKCYLVKYI